MGKQTEVNTTNKEDVVDEQNNQINEVNELDVQEN